MSAKNTENPIVIHVPKTGGTTLIVALTGERRQRRADETYRHILWIDPSKKIRMTSNAGDIFEPDGVSKYRNRQFTLVLRKPIDRLESEYNFLENRTEFRALWKRTNTSEYPDTFKEFVKMPSASESITKFLLGRDLYDASPVEEAVFERLVERLDELDFTFGVTEDMTRTVANAEHRLGIVCEKQLERHRTSIHKAPRGEDWPLIESVFEANNPMDLRLYQEVKSRFEAQIRALPGDAVEDRTFVGDAYDGLLGYVRSTERRVPFEIHQELLPDKVAFAAWKKANIHPLLHMHVMSLKKCEDDGRLYLLEWLTRAADKFLPDDDPFEPDPSDPLHSLRSLTGQLFAADD